MNLNKVTIAGRLTRDPEIRYTPKGTAVAELGVAINRSYTLESGERKEETTFLDAVAWGRTAENVGKWFEKGREIYLEGRLQLDTWNDKATGQKRSKLKLVAETFQFVGGKAKSETNQRQGVTAESREREHGTTSLINALGDDSEPPF